MDLQFDFHQDLILMEVIKTVIKMPPLCDCQPQSQSGGIMGQ